MEAAVLFLLGNCYLVLEQVSEIPETDSAAAGPQAVLGTLKRVPNAYDQPGALDRSSRCSRYPRWPDYRCANNR